MRAIQFAPDDDIIEICRDNVFKATFTRDNPLSQGALKGLISAYIGRKVETVTVIANEPPSSDIRDRQRETETSLGGRTKIIVVELEKAEGAARKSAAELSGEEKWALFFRYARERARRGLVNELLREEEGIAMAGEVLLTVSRDEIERARLDSEYEGALDYQSDMVSSRREGLAEGWEKRDKEAHQEKLASARRLKDMGFPPDKIALGLGLTAEEIEGL
ncbi:MAG: hypothetical protein LBQ55_07905 [Treponema sp.]|jgi:hypothetical protein|nr:hypothetical protein [Treponema sp.]